MMQPFPDNWQQNDAGCLVFDDLDPVLNVTPCCKPLEVSLKR